MASGGGVVKVIFQGFYSPKESSLKNSTRGFFGFECLSFTFCYLVFFFDPLRPVQFIVVGGWLGRISSPINLIF